MADFKDLLSGISKRQMKADYWLNFDYKEVENTELSNKKQVACLLYPELEAVDFDLLITSLSEIESSLNKNLSDYCDASDIIRGINSNMTEFGNNYYRVMAPKEVHPTPGIYWSFWFIVINKNRGKAISLCGAACDQTRTEGLAKHNKAQRFLSRYF